MYVITGSITSASRMAKAIEVFSGYPADVVHTPAEIRQGGCSYAVRCDDRALSIIDNIAKDNGISVKKIYNEKYINGERVFDDISG